MRSFHAAGAGSQTSMPMPAEVDGALAAPGLPGPTTNFTRQTSAAAAGGVPVVPDSASGSPCLNDLTSTTVVLASGLNAVFMLSLQVSATAGAGAGAGAGLSLPPQAARSAPVDAAAHAAQSRCKGRERAGALSPVRPVV